VDLAHRRGIGIVRGSPGVAVFGRRHGFRVAVGDGSNECSLDRRATLVNVRGRRDLVIGPRHGVMPFALVEGRPGLVVGWPQCQRDAPMCHGAAGVVPQRLLEACYGFRMVIAEAPVQPAVEPALRFRR
jgi:hypothetical protein